MSTGDLKNQGTRLQSLLRSAKYPGHVNYSSLFYGNPQEFLPLFHYLFQEYSLPFSKHLSQRGYEMSGKSDKHFIDVVYKALRDEFQYVPRLSREKFFSNGYTEQKFILTSSAYQYVLDRYRTSKKQKSKLNSNKENVKPIVIDQKNKEMPQKLGTSAETTSIVGPAYSPMRLAPKPDSTQLYNLSDVIEESIIEVPIEESAPQPLVYSEAGAREVYALDHLSAQSAVEILDSTPQTVLHAVEHVPVSETPAVFPVSVTKELEPIVTPPTLANPQMVVDKPSPDQCSQSCCHSRDIADIKQLLVTINARLDILEAKAKHSERMNNYSISNTNFTEQPVDMGMEKRATDTTLDNLFTDCTNSIQTNSSVPAINQTNNNSNEDIKIFLQSVKEKLNNTRSFLRTYETNT